MESYGAPGVSQATWHNGKPDPWLAVATSAVPERTETSTVNAATTTQLSAHDRCDRCGAQAYVRVHLISGGELLFCAHHGREHADRMRAAGHEIHDQSGRLSHSE
jgi:ribosomal protein L37E